MSNDSARINYMETLTTEEGFNAFDKGAAHPEPNERGIVQCTWQGTGLVAFCANLEVVMLHHGNGRVWLRSAPTWKL